MIPYWSDERGRYSTGESYDWFQKYEDGVETFDSEDGLWTCTLLEDGVEILRYNGNEINITVPAEIAGKRVVSLDSTFDGFYELKSAVILEGVTSVVGVFYGCEGLEKITLPKGVTDLDWTFNSCYSLKEVEIPDSANSFSFTFPYTQLKSIRFPDGTIDISGVFCDSNSLEYAYIPKSVVYTYEAFCDCKTLREVVLEEGITRIGDYTFLNCTQLKELTIPKSVVEFGEYASAAEQYAKENGITFIKKHPHDGMGAFDVQNIL